VTEEAQVLPLRDYQRDGIAKLHAAWDRGVRRPALVLPTGGGKTVMFGHITAEFLDQQPRRRALVLAHRDELVTQAAQKIKSIAPHLPVGIVKAERNDTWARVVVASVQSLRSERRLAALRDVGLIVVDECHHATAKTYKAILGHYGAFDDASDVQVVGVTATLARSDRQALGEVWQEAIVVASVIDLVKAGHLLDPKGKRIEVPDLRLGEVRKSRGDYQDGDLGRAMVGSLAPEIVAKAYLEHAPTDHGVAFWPTVEAAQVGAEAMNDHGIRTEVIHGKTPLDQRRDILRRADEGRVQALSNCMVLTEGFDWPRARVAVIARPTQSAPLYQQMVGRVLRPFPGQDQALILDVVGASLMHNLASLIDLSEKDVKIRDGESLAEALEREEAERDDRDEVEPTLYRGDTVAADFDPLGRAAKRVWARTRGGTAFLAVSDRYVFLVPATGPDAAPGTWDVAWAAADRPIGGRYGAFLHREVELGYAARWAELHVDELATGSREGNARSFTSKRSAWRKSHPSGTQVRLAARFGIVAEGDMNAGELSELIDGAKASPTVDTFVNRILGR
jgi:superfamily II DNA or RNA helicase